MILTNKIQLNLKKNYQNGKMVAIGAGISNGTFGELLQGTLPNGKRFLVTLPIQKYSRAFFIHDHKILKVLPSTKSKSIRLAKLILEHYQLSVTGTLFIDSDLLEGKGMASSSADLVATALAIKAAFNLDMPTEIIENFMREIEPSDGIMYSGFVSYYYLEVKLKKSLGYLPELVILGVDEGGQVDTIEFNKTSFQVSDEEKRYFATLLSELELSIMQKDLYKIGTISTESAKIAQEYCPKACFDDILNISKKINALGIVAAHSGTCIGILLDRADKKLNSKIIEGLNLLKKLNRQPFICSTVVENVLINEEYT